MIGLALKIFNRLTRSDTCGLVFLSILLPLYYKTSDVCYAFFQSLPVLTISMCGFIINDLHDIEKDLKNHPERPLPSGQISPTSASILYFILLTISLALIKANVKQTSTMFLDLFLLIALINYNYVVYFFPHLKNFFVAMVGTVPIIILTSLIGAVYLELSAALFLCVLSREMLMDVQDMKGDAETLVKKIGIPLTENTAFAVKVSSSLILLSISHAVVEQIIGFTLLIVDIILALLWKYGDNRSIIIFIIKSELFVGIYYLL